MKLRVNRDMSFDDIKKYLYPVEKCVKEKVFNECKYFMFVNKFIKFLE